eukprot:6187625-Pleurochrysis_carterae.AAC.1
MKASKMPTKKSLSPSHGNTHGVASGDSQFRRDWDRTGCGRARLRGARPAGASTSLPQAHPLHLHCFVTILAERRRSLNLHPNCSRPSPASRPQS